MVILVQTMPFRITVPGIAWSVLVTGLTGASIRIKASQAGMPRQTRCAIKDLLLRSELLHLQGVHQDPEIMALFLPEKALQAKATQDLQTQNHPRQQEGRVADNHKQLKIKLVQLIFRKGPSFTIN